MMWEREKEEGEAERGTWMVWTVTMSPRLIDADDGGAEIFEFVVVVVVAVASRNAVVRRLRQRSYHSSHLVLSHPNWVAASALWSDPVRHRRDESERSRSRRRRRHLRLVAATANRGSLHSALSAAYTVQKKRGQLADMRWDETGWVTGTVLQSARCDCTAQLRNSIGMGKMMVEFFSAEMVFSVWR